MTPNKLVNQVLKEASSPLPTPQPGIDFEGEDRSVGIFGNAWIFTGTDDKTYVLCDDGELRRDSGGQDITVAKAPETNALFQQVVKMYDDEHGKKPKPKQVSSREEVDDAVNKILRPSESTVNLTQKLEDVSDKLRRQGISAVVEYPEVVDVTLKIEAEVEGVAFGFVNGPWLGYTAYDKAGGSIEGEGMSGEGDVSEESSADEMVEYIKSVVSKMSAPEGDKIVKVMKPDGTTYEASFSGKYYDHPKRGKVASIAKLLPNGEWTHTMLAPGEKIIESDEVPDSIKEFSNKLFRYVPALATRADFRDEDEVMPEPGQTPGSFIV